MQHGLLGGVHVGAADACGGTASEELPWRDVNFSEGFLWRKELVRRVKFVLLSTDTAHFGHLMCVFFLA